jgi:hypothetical protein
MLTITDSALFASKNTEHPTRDYIVTTPAGFAIPCSLPELRWWIAVQGVYARSIGSSFARPMNDNALRGGAR